MTDTYSPDSLAPNLTLDAKITAKEGEIAAVRQRIEQHALDSHHGLPGANAALAQDHEDLNRLQRELSDLEAAQRAQEAQERATQAAATAVAEAKVDKALQADWNKLASIAAEGEPILAAYAAWYERLTAQHAKCVAGLPLNPRARQDLGHFSLFEAVRQDLAHLTTVNVPGANPLARGTSDAATRQTLAAQLADLAGCVLPHATKRRAA
jgi:hypothetical protein